MENLVIFGGSFDPVHNGHLRLAEAASNKYNADVVFIPAKKPRWKETTASDKDRLAMLKLALIDEGNSAFSISNCEMKRPGDVTYSIDTVREIKKLYPKRHLLLLIGADQVNQFSEWKEPDNLAKEASIIYSDRPGVKVDTKIVKKYAMTSLDFKESGEVSSSAIRTLHSADIAPAVMYYIEEHGLYYMEKLINMEDSKRLAHSLSVAHLAKAIASSNHLWHPDAAYIAGLLHDLGKNVDEEEARKIMKEEYPLYVNYPSWCLHQFVGAYLANKEFDIKDGEVLDAIEYHCSGKAHMPPISKVIYSADKIDPLRGWNSKSYIKACLEDYYAGFLKVLKANRKYLVQKGSDVAEVPLSEACFNQYLEGEK
jgi:nicotinate-nucleotide adenylyltransferase